MKISRYIFALSLTLMFWGSLAHSESPQLLPMVPIEAFFATPDIAQVRLSDDGRRVASLVRTETGRNAIATLDLETMKGGVIFKPNDYNIQYLFWKGERIVFGGDAGGNESLSMRSIQYDGRGLRDLNESYKEFQVIEGPVGANVASRLRKDPDNIVIHGYGAAKNSFGEWEPTDTHGVFLLNIRTLKRELVEASHERSISTLVDPVTGAVYGRVLQSGAEAVYELKQNGVGSYAEVLRRPLAEEGWDFAGLSPDKKTAYLLVSGINGIDRVSLVGFDLKTMKMAGVLFAPPEGELTELKRDESGRIVGATYEAEKTVTVWFDPEWSRMFAGLQATFPGAQVDIVQSVAGSRFHVIMVHSDRDPGTFYIYDAKLPKIYPVGKRLPGIDPKRMAAMQPISFVARDGLLIHGYLTQPNDAQKWHSLILVPHGGPFGIRDSWGFDPEVQFLASRGYAVLQVNYRGSGGYGVNFQDLGRCQWGLKMQDDLTDAVKWAIKEGYTHADQVAISGASYGGYATLAGLVFTPELYRCGVNYVGVSDIRLLTNSGFYKGRGADAWYKTWLGSDKDDLRARSPVEFVERITVPSLHAYGDNDPRVTIAHWKELERQLKKYGKKYIFFREGDEGHGFRNESTKLKFYRAVEQFLAENLKPLPQGVLRYGPLEVIEMPAKEPAKK